VTVCSQVKHLGIQTITKANSAFHPSGYRPVCCMGLNKMGRIQPCQAAAGNTVTLRSSTTGYHEKPWTFLYVDLWAVKHGSTRWYSSAYEATQYRPRPTRIRFNTTGCSVLCDLS